MWMVVDAATGEVLRRGLASEPTLEEGEEAQRESALAGAVWVPRDRCWLLDRWSIASARADGVERLRLLRWEMVKEARDRAESWGCNSPLGRVDTDAVSRVKVAGAVQLAMIAATAGEPFEIAWTMQSNVAAKHDGPAMIAMGVAVGRHVAACHAVALLKRAAIEAAADAAAIAAVDVEGGWPDAPDV